VWRRIALALSCNPSVLLADEPTTALDVTVQIQILLLLRELQREFGMAVIFVTHDVGATVEVSDRIAVMYAGRLVETDNLRDVLKRHAHPYTEGLLAANLHSAEPGARLTTIPGSPPNLAVLPQGCAFAPRCVYALDGCRLTDPPPMPCGDGHIARCLRVEERLRAFA
jgi:peptide/nickel transport system ATP-binding protein